MKCLYSVCVLALVAGCTSEATDGSDSLINVLREPAGEHCVNGGILVLSGTDANGNGVLDDSEVAGSQFVCNGVDAAEPVEVSTQLVEAEEEAAGTNCANGGVAIHTGTDTNGNGSLEASEITNTEYICNGNDPEEGLPTQLGRKTYLGDADDTCPGGYVRYDFGTDTNSDGNLSDDEVEDRIVGCNQLPKVTIENGSRVIVDDCSQELTLRATGDDIDGTVESIAWALVRSGSELTLSGTDTNMLTIAGGTHVGGARISVTFTDNFGAMTTQYVTVAFVGEGCIIGRLSEVREETCISIDVDNLAGDDRGAPVISGEYVYYNGDDGLVRASSEDLSGLERVSTQQIDTLFSNVNTGGLYSLWVSSWTQTNLLDASLVLDTDEHNWDTIVKVDETTFDVAAVMTLDTPVDSSGSTFRLYDLAIFSGQDQFALGIRGRYDATSDDFVSYRVFDWTGATTYTREYLESSFGNSMDFSRRSWATQESDISKYPLEGTAGNLSLTYRDGADYDFHRLLIETDTTELFSADLANNCDISNMAVDPTSMTVFFHDEGDCFNNTNAYETIIRCEADFFLP